MKIKTWKCPSCGEPAIGTVDLVPGVALFSEIDADGNTEWAGETQMFWDGQETRRYKDEPTGLPLVQCANGHEWPTEIEPARGTGPAFTQMPGATGAVSDPRPLSQGQWWWAARATGSALTMKKKDRLKQVSPERDVEYYSLNFQELSTVLAALRVFQRVRNLNSPDQCWRVEQMEHFETVKPLTDGEIDSLCERINYSKSRACVRWPKYVQAAKRLFHVEGEIEVDDSALVSEGDDHGAHVQAWVWVPVEEIRKKRQGVRP